MPKPNLGPFIPSPTDQFGEGAAAAKKVALVVGAVTAAQLLERRFPKTTGPLVHFLTGLETVAGKGIKIKPGFVAWAGPQPIGATPPSLTGLPDVTGHPLDLLDSGKIKESADKQQKERRERDELVISKSIVDALPALRERDIGFVAQVITKSRIRLAELGPAPTDRIVVSVGTKGPVDERLFTQLVLDAALAEVERRRDAGDPRLIPVVRPPQKDGGATGYNVPETDGRLDPILVALNALDAFMSLNPADP